MAEHRHLKRLTATEEHDLELLRRTLRRAAVRPTRRDLMRWSAIASGAVATNRLGLREASATPRPLLPTAQEGDFEQNAEIVVPFDAFGQAVTLDPHRSADYGGFWVVYPNVWAGLLRYDELGRIQLDLAESGTISDDSLTYTFTLKPDLRYAIGNPVLASHFVDSWTRALDPANLSPMAAFMQHVQGFTEHTSGQAGATLGFAAPDDRTVTITLSQPYSYFLSFLASFVWSVVDPQILAEAGQENFVLNGAGAGPWQFTAYELDSQFVMEPNPNYYAGVSPSLTRVVWPILTGPTAAREALDRYRNDEAVSADVPLSLKADVEGDPVLSQELRRIDQFPSTTRSLAFDFRQPPFDDVRVRRAFGLAFDRDRYAEIYEGTWAPTSAFAPPVLAEIAGYQPPEGLGFNPDEARALLEQAGYPGGQGLPQITYYHPAGDVAAELDRVRAVLQIFQDNLGVAITLDDTRTLQQISDLRGDMGGLQFDIIWWQNVAETPHLISQVFHPDSPYMRGVFNWSVDLPAIGDFNPGADAQSFIDLMAQADMSQDQAQRNDLYRQGEELALRNAVYVPIANWVPMYLQKPYLQGTRQGSWTGRFPALFDESVVVRR
jgi:ABC-type transport system substrate-binding protein